MFARFHPLAPSARLSQALPAIDFGRAMVTVALQGIAWIPASTLPVRFRARSVVHDCG